MYGCCMVMWHDYLCMLASSLSLVDCFHPRPLPVVYGGCLDTWVHGRRDGCDGLPIVPLIRVGQHLGIDPHMGTQPEGWPWLPTHSVVDSLWAEPHHLGLEKMWPVGHVKLTNRVLSIWFEWPQFEPRAIYSNEGHSNEMKGPCSNRLNIVSMIRTRACSFKWMALDSN